MGKLKNVGQFWKGNDKNKNPMLSGYVDLGVLGRLNVLVLQNGQKKETAHPDYLMFVKDGNEEPEEPPSDKGL